MATPPPSFEAVADALRASWARDTSDDHDADAWSPENPALGQCTVTALVLQDLLGGELLESEVHFRSGGLQGHHYSNRLPDGTDVDLTLEQFSPEEVVGEPVVVPMAITRPPNPSARQYVVLRDRVLARLGLAG